MNVTDSTSAYLLLGVMGFLLVVLLIMHRIFMMLKTGLYPSAVSHPVLKVHSEPAVIVAATAEPGEQEFMTDHVYDGIYELDNNLPRWWQYLFYATIIFSVIYMVRYFTGSLPTQEEELNSALLVAASELEEYRKENAAQVDETSVTLLDDPAGIHEGKVLFDQNCLACHGALGEGGVGPNLTDEFWIHGGNISDIFRTIKYGVPEKGMKSWQAELKPLQIQQVSSYIMSLAGTNPPNAKAPQGEKLEQAASAVDTEKVE